MNSSHLILSLLLGTVATNPTSSMAATHVTSHTISGRVVGQALVRTTAAKSVVDKKIEMDRKAIHSLAGVYNVTFNFAETFSDNPNYKAHKPYQADGLEWVQIIEDSPNKIVLQHLLIVDSGQIVKHWREDWSYENTEFLKYDKNFTWKKSIEPKSKVKGQWSQKVFQVDDSPRYEASATWVHADGHSVWEATADAPLPRREYTKRSDYNVLERTNRVTVETGKWTHEEFNKKVLRTATNDSVLTEEYGRNLYKQVDPAQGAPAARWWNKNADYWKVVRAAWDNTFRQYSTITLSIGGKGPQLWDKLGELSDKSATMDKAAMQREVESTIASFIVNDRSMR